MNSGTVERYAESVRQARVNPLTLAQTDRLAARARAGDRRAAEKLVGACMGLVLKIVTRAVAGKVVSVQRKEELLQAAATEIYNSIRKWDPEKGHYRTFAVRGAELQIRRELAIGVTNCPVTLRQDLSRAASAVLSGSETFEEAALTHGCSEITLADALAVVQTSFVSVDAERETSEGDSWTLPVSDPEAEQDYEEVLERAESELVWKLIDHAGLHESERYVICSKYGALGHEQKTISALAREFEMDQRIFWNRVKRIEKKLKVAVAIAVLMPPGETSMPSSGDEAA